jgi:glucans biosynthesis protein C
VRTPTLGYASEAVLPIYIIHHPLVVATSIVVTTWPVGLWVKHLAIVAGSFAATWVVYEVGVRRVRPVRILFGLRPPEPEVEPAPEPVEAPAPSA